MYLFKDPASHNESLNNLWFYVAEDILPACPYTDDRIVTKKGPFGIHIERSLGFTVQECEVILTIFPLLPRQ